MSNLLPSSWLRCQKLFALLGALLLSGSPAVAQIAPLAPATVQHIKPDSGPWDSGAGFQFDLGKKKSQKVRQSVSGLACNLNAAKQRVCLVVFDEGTQARYATVQNASLVPDQQVLSFTGITGELDGEAAATDGRYVYVVGSHSVKRSDCASNPASRHLIRFELDPATGQVLPHSSIDSGQLWVLMQAQPELAAHVGKCLGSETSAKAPRLAGAQGTNIEGLAVKDGRLFVGFRGPVVNGEALVMALNADAFFKDGPVQPSVTRLALGERRGIRDMVAVSDGLLLLAGPDDDSTATGWAVYGWNVKPGQALVRPKLLAVLDLSQVKLRPCDAALKPEAITVLKETTSTYQVLVLSDGMCDGGPLVFTVPR
jgi:hypothetical protein